MVQNIPLQQFHQDAKASVGLHERRAFLRDALHGYENTRANAESDCVDWEAARKVAAAIKWDAIENLDQHLQTFADNLEAKGVHVAWANTGDDAVQYIADVLAHHQAQSVVKSKTMTSEEIHLNPALEKQGLEVVESDLGEFIVQLNGQAPYHFVFPAMHLKRGEIAALFQEKLGDVAAGKGDDPETLTMIARDVLRQVYLKADVGISGANFGVAETGMVSITENEGNARLTCALPKVHIVLMGIEKVVPKLEDLGVLLPMLSIAGTGQNLTAYNTQYGGPRQPGETDGPEEMHVVLLDNHRAELLAEPEQRDALRCIRCGACLNVCPIYKNIGGFSYGTTYQGPIGSVITPHLRGLKDWAHLSSASSLCGACTEVCPVKIDLHHHLLRNRQQAVAKHADAKLKLSGWVMGQVLTKPSLYKWLPLGRKLAGLWPKAWEGKAFDPLKAWRASRTLPEQPEQTFKQWLASRDSQTPSGGTGASRG